MADIGSAIRAILAADGTVTGLVSTRIYPDRLPQNVTLPAIVYEHDAELSHDHHGGLSGFADSYVIVTAYARTRLSATAIQDAVRLALAHYQGTSASVVVRRIHVGQGTTDVDEPEDASDLPIWYHEREYHAFYVEATS